MAETGTAAIAVKVGIEVFKAVVPRGFAKTRAWLSGKVVLILGPKESGKTRFVNYLQYGILLPEKEELPTAKDPPTATFSIIVGRDKSLHLNLRSVIDVSGQAAADIQAEKILERRPHGVVIIIDAG